MVKPINMFMNLFRFQLLVRPKLPVAETVPFVSMANVLSVTRDSLMQDIPSVRTLHVAFHVR